MRKPGRIPWLAPETGRAEYAFIRKALDANFINEGALAALLEKQFRTLLKIDYAVTANSGTTAIFLALKAVGVGPGDEVLVPDITFIATANAVTLTGAKPVLVDVEPETLTMSVPAAARAVTRKTRAIVPVHVSGRAADMTRLMALARRRRLFVIEDAAEALGSKYRGRPLGTLGDAGCFSLSANKVVSAGLGGVVVTRNVEVFHRLKALKNQGRPQRGTGGDDVHDTVGFNFRFTDLQAGYALGQMIRFPRRVARMLRTHRMYLRELAGIPGIRVFGSRKGEIPMWTDALAEHRDALVATLKARNIDCRNYWFPIHTQAPYRRPHARFPASTRLAPKALWLPSAFNITDRQVLRVCREIRRFYGSLRREG